MNSYFRIGKIWSNTWEEPQRDKKYEDIREWRDQQWDGFLGVQKTFCRGEWVFIKRLSWFAMGLTIPHVQSVLFSSNCCSGRDLLLCSLNSLVCTICFLAVWVVDAQPGPWGGWLCALLPVLVCARQPALLVLPAAQEHGHCSQRARHGSYWKMWVSAIHGHRQVSESDLVRMPFLSNSCPYIAGVHMASCITAL